MGISLTKSTYKYTEPSFSATLDTPFTAPAVPVWSVDNSIISGDRTNSLTISPLNRTSECFVTAYLGNLWNGNSTLGANMSFSGNDLVKTTGTGISTSYASGTPHNFYVNGQTIVSIVDGKFRTDSNEAHLGFGSANNNTDLKCFWKVVGNKAYAYADNNIVHEEFIVTNDSLRIILVDGKQAKWYKNGVLVFDYWFYPIFTSGYALARLGNGSANTKIISPAHSINQSKYSTSFQSYGLFFWQPNYPFDIRPDTGDINSFAEDKSKVSLIKGDVEKKSLTFNNRLNSEASAIKEFYEWHKTARPFYFEDLVFFNGRLVTMDGFSMTCQRIDRFNINLGLSNFDTTFYKIDSESPTTPLNLAGTPFSESRIDLVWDSATDTYGVTGYEISKNGVVIDVGFVTNYSDTSVSPVNLYEYQVRAYDSRGNKSLWSNLVGVQLGQYVVDESGNEVVDESSALVYSI